MKSIATVASNDRQGTLTRYAWRLLLAVVFLSAATSAFALQGQLNINTATLEELQALPFIGKTKAAAIIEMRRQGNFHGLSKLQDSPAIGPSTYQAILPYIKLSGPHTLTGSSSPSGKITSTGAEKLIITKPGEVQLLTDGQYYETLTHLIRTAQQQIDITTFIFKTNQGKNNRPWHIIEELAIAHKRGIKTQVILEKSDYDKDLNKENRHTANLLRKNGIGVAFDKEKTTTHAKIAVIDRHLCLLGSHNLTNAALGYNHETSLLINSHELAEQLLAYMEQLPE